MALTLTDCYATENSITIYFSEPVDTTSAQTLGNYTVYDSNSTNFASLTPLSDTSLAPAPTITGVGPMVRITFSFSSNAFNNADLVVVTVSGVQGQSGDQFSSSSATIAAVVGGKNQLRIVNCVASPTNVTVYFSEHLDTSQLGSKSGSDPTLTNSYTVAPVQSQQGSADTLGTAVQLKSAQYDPFRKATFLELGPTSGLTPGQWILVTVNNVASKAGTISNGGNNTFSTRVNGGESHDVGDQGDRGAKREAAEVTGSVEDAVAYPLLTEQVSFPAGGGGPSVGGATSAGRAASLDTRAALAVGDVLGWKVNSSDARGFVGALTQAFTLTEVEGHTEAAWNPRTYAVQTDLGGGITGAQASLYTRAQDAVQQSLKLLDGLYPLDPDADPEYVKALREMAKSQMNEILLQFGAVGGPSILRVNTYFEILLGQSRPSHEGGGTQMSQGGPSYESGGLQFDPDKIRGTLGTLRDTYGIYFVNNPFLNSIEDEQDITNFRVISDYMTSLLQSWISNEQFFQLGTKTPAFFGTQLVLLSRQLSVIAETVNEVRFALESVFIGPSDRQMLLLQFEDRRFPAMFLEDMLQEVEDFVSGEGPRLLQDGGKISVTNNILPVLYKFRDLVRQAHRPSNIRQLPDGYRTVRVQRSLDDLGDQIRAMIELSEPVGQQVPPPIEEEEEGTSVSSVSPNHVWSWGSGSTASVTIIGAGFKPGIQATFRPSGGGSGPTIAAAASFLSENLAAAQIKITGSVQDRTTYDVTVRNPDRTSATLPRGFTLGGYSGDAPSAGATRSSTAATLDPQPTGDGLAALKQHIDDAVKGQHEGIAARMEERLKQHTTEILAKMQELVEKKKG